MQIELRDFQAHAKTALHLKGGFACIVGPSNVGKSSIVRAIRWMLYDSMRGNRFVRQGQETASVSIDFGDVQVTRVKGKKQNRYLVGTTAYDAIGTGAPPEVVRATQVPFLRVDKDKDVELNVSMQLDQPFLIFESEGLRAKFLNVLTGGHVIDAAVRETNRKAKELEGTHRQVVAQLEFAKEQIKAFADLPEREQRLRGLSDQLGKLNMLTQRVAMLKGIRQRREQIGNERFKLQQQARAVAPITEAMVTQVNAAIALRTVLGGIRDRLTVVIAERSKLIPRMHAVTPITEVTVQRFNAAIVRRTTLTGAWDRLTRVRAERAALAQRAQILAAWTPQLIDSYLLVIDRVAKVKAAWKRVVDLRNLRQFVTTDLAANERQTAFVMAQIEALPDAPCPTCGQLVTRDVRLKRVVVPA